MTRAWLLASLVLVLVGCGGAIRESRMSNFRQDVLPRAAFELGCSAEQLAVSDVSPETAEWEGAMMGVEGCGNRAVYVYVSGTGWVNNTGRTQ
jgi:hypothetical protein